MKKHLVATVMCAVFGIAGVAHGDVLFFLDEAEFQAALEQAGKVLKGFEDFPWFAGPGSVTGADDPIDVNTSIPGWIKPGILLDNITYQSNLDPFGANGPNPRGPGGSGMNLFTQGFIGATHNGLISGHFVDSLDILSGPPAGDNHTAMGLQVVTFNNVMPGGSITVSVYGKDDNLMGTAADISAPPNQGGAFVGILSTGGDTIGRVNLYDTIVGFAAEGLYSIAAYVSGLCPWDLDYNNDVGVGDMLILLGAWGPNPGHPADFDGNGNVGVSDLLELLANWGPCP